MITLASADKAHAGDRIARPLTDETGRVLNAVLWQVYGLRIQPTPDLAGVVQLWPDRPLSTVEEVRATRAIKAVTDSPLHWNRPGVKP